MNNDGNRKRKAALDPTVRRTSISAAGNITESEVPLSTLKKEAIDLSAETSNPTTLLLTRDAAMKITENAITSAIENAWSDLVSENPSDAKTSATNPSVRESKKAKKKSRQAPTNAYAGKSNNTENSNMKNIKGNKGRAPATNEPSVTVRSNGADNPGGNVVSQPEPNENDATSVPKGPGKTKKKAETKSIPEMRTQKKSPNSKEAKKSFSSPSANGSKKKPPKPEESSPDPGKFA